jgi:hypothetical protein
MFKIQTNSWTCTSKPVLCFVLFCFLDSCRMIPPRTVLYSSPPAF